MPENIITQKVGPLPLVVWVAGGAGVVGLFILMTHKGNNGASANQTNQINALSPTEAQAFGTIEQQQQDVTNALTTLGNNQSALGGSMSTLTGIVTQQGADNAAAFQNLVNGQQQIEQGQTAAASNADRYYSSLLANIQNYGNSLGSQLNGINTGVNAGNYNAWQYYMWLTGQVANVGSQVQGVSNQVSGVSGQVSGVSGQVSGVSRQVSGVSGQVNTVGNQVSGVWGPLQNIVMRLSTLSSQEGYGPGPG